MASRVRCAAAATAALAIAAAAFWPWTDRYTSVGLDFECADAGVVRCTFWRLRWPGDGSIAVCRETSMRAPGERPIEAWDFGARFCHPPRDLAADGFWPRHGFWWIHHAPANGAPPPIVAGAKTAVLLGLPHWLVTVSLGALAVWLRRRARGATCPSSAPATCTRRPSPRTR